MAEYTVTTNLLKTKKAKLIALILIIAVAGFAVYWRVSGGSFHIKSGQTKGTNVTVTEYLDNQDTIEGKVTDVPPDGAGGYFVIVGGGVAIDLSLVQHSQNLHQPISHFIRGNIKTGDHIKAVVRKSSPNQNLHSYDINQWYEVWPADPFFIAVE